MLVHLLVRASPLSFLLHGSLIPCLQLSTVPPKEGKTIDAYFEKKHNWINDVSVGKWPLGRSA